MPKTKLLLEPGRKTGGGDARAGQARLLGEQVKVFRVLSGLRVDVVEICLKTHRLFFPWELGERPATFIVVDYDQYFKIDSSVRL